MDKSKIFEAISDSELFAEVKCRGFEVALPQAAGSLALDGAQAEATSEASIISA